MPARFGGFETFNSFYFLLLHPHLRPFHDVERWALVLARFGGSKAVWSSLAVARRAMVGPDCPLASVGLRRSFSFYFLLPYPHLRPFHDVEWWAFAPARFGGLKVVWSFLAIARRAMVGLCCPLASAGWKCSYLFLARFFTPFSGCFTTWNSGPLCPLASVGWRW